MVQYAVDLSNNCLTTARFIPRSVPHCAPATIVRPLQETQGGARLVAALLQQELAIPAHKICQLKRPRNASPELPRAQL